MSGTLQGLEHCRVWNTALSRVWNTALKLKRCSEPYCSLASFTLFTPAVGILFIRTVHMMFTAFMDILLHSNMLIVTRSL